MYGSGSLPLCELCVLWMGEDNDATGLRAAGYVRNARESRDARARRRPRAMSGCSLASSAREYLATLSAVGSPSSDKRAISAGPPSGLLAPIGSVTGRQMKAWCPNGGRVLRRSLLGLRSFPDGIVVDVGSFDASDAVLFAHSSKRHVWTFEPSPSKHESIRQRLRQEGLADNGL
jgi:hypothetical protein